MSTDIDGLDGGEFKLISQNFPAKMSNLPGNLDITIDDDESN